MGKAADDIRVGEITLEDRPVEKVLGEASVEVTVQEKSNHIPIKLRRK